MYEQTTCKLTSVVCDDADTLHSAPLNSIRRLSSSEMQSQTERMSFVAATCIVRADLHLQINLKTFYWLSAACPGQFPELSRYQFSLCHETVLWKYYWRWTWLRPACLCPSNARLVNVSPVLICQLRNNSLMLVRGTRRHFSWGPDQCFAIITGWLRIISAYYEAACQGN